MIVNSLYLNALLDGNPKIIKTIYKNTFPKVLRFIFQNKGQREDAEDIFQKALIQLAIRYKKEPFEVKTSFEAYLFTVCKNLWRRELNKKKNKVTKDNIIELQDENDDIALALLEQKRWELFNESLNLISENCRQVLKLFFSKTPYATMMGTLDYNSETVVRQRVFKCKKKLKEIVTKDKRYNSLLEL